MGSNRDDYIKDVNSLSDKEVEKLKIVSDSIAKRFDAEARKESQLKWRILFERTAPEMLPFVIYCLTFGPIGVFSFSKVMDLKGNNEFYFGLFGLLVIMILPVLILPQIPFKKWLRHTEIKKESNVSN